MATAQTVKGNKKLSAPELFMQGAKKGFTLVLN